MPDYRKKRQELRKVLKRKALDRLSQPDSECTVHTIISQNEMFSRMRQMRQDIPDDHKSLIKSIRETIELHGDLPRAVMQLNALERLHGNTVSWLTKSSSDFAQMAPSGQTIH
jgi:predicted AlkP superfamily phosphohydrolase/phosphomutase